MTRPDLQKVCVLVVGDVMLDRYWFGDVNRISPEAPVPVARIVREEVRAGGAANVARNVAAIGARVDVLAVTGDDDAARELEALLRSDGVEVAFSRDPALKTTVKLRVIGRQQQLLRIDFENVPGAEALASKLAGFDERIQNADAVIFSDYGKGGLAHVEQMIARARKLGKPVLVDPKGDDYTRYRHATVLTPNRSEFRQVVGAWRNEDDMTARAQQLRATLDLQALLVTRSEEGMSLYESGGATHVPTLAQEVFDVSGAGDTVIAVMGTLLAAGYALGDAVQWANRAAGIVVGKLGTAVVHPDELFG
jgi:D-glycero-beta-D-manno-heptose-7-phosphate kinase